MLCSARGRSRKQGVHLNTPPHEAGCAQQRTSALRPPTPISKLGMRAPPLFLGVAYWPHPYYLLGFACR